MFVTQAEEVAINLLIVHTQGRSTGEIRQRVAGKHYGKPGGDAANGFGQLGMPHGTQGTALIKMLVGHDFGSRAYWCTRHIMFAELFDGHLSGELAQPLLNLLPQCLKIFIAALRRRKACVAIQLRGFKRAAQALPLLFAGDGDDNSASWV